LNGTQERVSKENAVVLRDIIKTIGQKLVSVLNGSQEARVQNRFYSFIIGRKEKQSAFVMNKMVTYFGTKQGGVTGYIHRARVQTTLG
jgi:hypothetical protein